MGSEEELRRLLEREDGHGYPGYRGLRGHWSLPGAELHVDAVQADPYAPASRIRARVPLPAGFPVDEELAVLCLGDLVTRRVAAAIDRTPAASGLSIDRPGQAVLRRSSVVVDGDRLDIRLRAALPARGRRIRGREAWTMLGEALPKVLDQAAGPRSGLGPLAVAQHALLADQEALRERLDDHGLVAFLGREAILPRASGASDRPLAQGAAPLRVPTELQASMRLPDGRTVTGLGIPEGVTVIVGGGYHGKSTLLEALARGVHPHIAGDGREWVITEPSAVALRAEDGRCVNGTDISDFISGLPSGTDTSHFRTLDASGSTSQAAGLVEAVESGSRLLLMDEDTCAANFMVRDARMRRLVSDAREPINPLVHALRGLHREAGVSTVLVAGSSGAFFDAADHVIEMCDYQPEDVTERARKIAAGAPLMPPTASVGAALGSLPRRSRSRVLSGIGAQRDAGRPPRARGRERIQLGDEHLDLGGLEQLLEASQTEAIARLLPEVLRRSARGQTLSAAVGASLAEVEEGSLDLLGSGSGHPGELVLPRRQELLAAAARLRWLA